MIIYNDHRKEKPHKINDENFIINVINDHFRQIMMNIFSSAKVISI